VSIGAHSVASDGFSDGYHRSRACQSSCCYALCGQKNFCELLLLLSSFFLIQAPLLCDTSPHTPHAVLWTQCLLDTVQTVSKQTAIPASLDTRDSLSKKRGAQTGSLEVRLNGPQCFRRQGCIQDTRPSRIHSCRSLANHFVILELCQVTLERTLGRHQEVFPAPLVQRRESQPLRIAVGQLMLDDLDIFFKKKIKAWFAHVVRAVSTV
jgi:hypothetical protein